MQTEHMIDGKPLAECTTEALYSEWDAGMRLDTMDGLNPTQQARLEAVEKELFSRPARDE